MTIRKDFPALNPAQVQQILGEYQLGPGKSRPRGWFPPPEEVEPALRTGKLQRRLHRKLAAFRLTRVCTCAVFFNATATQTVEPVSTFLYIDVALYMILLPQTQFLPSFQSDMLPYWKPV